MPQLEEFTVVNLRESYDPQLLHRVYYDFLKKMFPIEDELDPIEVLEATLDPEQRGGDEQAAEMHLVVVLERNDAVANLAERQIVGAVEFEYYKLSNSCLVSYFAVDEAHRRGGMGRSLMKLAWDTCSKMAKMVPRPEGTPTTAYEWVAHLSRLPPSCSAIVREVAEQCTPQEVEEMNRARDAGWDGTSSLAVLFAETNAEGVEDAVMDPKARHGVLSRLGFRPLSFPYVQPPLSDSQDPCYDLLLLVMAAPPAAPLPADGFPTLLLRVFLADFARSVFGSIPSFTDLSWWKGMDQSFRPLTPYGPPSPPWSERTPLPQ